MPHRRHAVHAALARSSPRPAPIAVAFRRTLAAGYDGAALRADLLAGTVVGIVALPLSMALAIAVGVPPQHGLYTAIVAGIVAALAGGSKFQSRDQRQRSWSSSRQSRHGTASRSS